ncbi:MAG TPA: VTT domain-containing protein [Candidatus Acidoferrales bacterium]|jgi:membrane protein YqaA with SNARE-associated domain|nr:VTT domain-containing protein [Candidatus Acidoferrales bacterium]
MIAQLEGAVGWIQFRSWLKLTLPALGGVGLLLSAFIDSSFVPLPLVTDLLLMELSSRHPVRMPFYVAMAALGSLGGCIWIYWLARKSGQAYYRKSQGHAPGRIRKFIQEYPMASVLLPAVAPFPVPFKPFVIAQGVFQVPLATFVIGTLVGRGSLFLLEGFLGARYGAEAKQFLVNQKWASFALALGFVLVFLLIRRLPALRKTEYSQTD